MNMLEEQLARRDGSLAVDVGGQQLALGDQALGSRPALRNYEGKTVIVGIRPEHVEDATLAEAPPDRRLRGVLLTEALGSEIVAHVAVEAKPALTEDVRELAQTSARTSTRRSRRARRHSSAASGRARLGVSVTAELAVDTGALHFFDRTRGGIYDEETTKGTS